MFKNIGKLILVIVIALNLACRLNQECKCEVNPITLIKNDSLLNILDKSNSNTGFDYFGQFDKTILSKNSMESYRLTVNSLSFNFAKIYEFQKIEEKCLLVVDEYSQSQKGVREVKLFNSKKVELTRSDWLNFKSSIDNNCFWVIETDINTDDSYLDGSQWTLEGNLGENYCTNSDYHVIVRNSPDSSRFLNICNEIFELEPLNARNIYKWE